MRTSSSAISSIFLLLALATPSKAFLPQYSSKNFHQRTALQLNESANDESNEQNTSIPSRRQVFTNVLSKAATVAIITATSTPAFAKDELFKPNPLTNPILEKVRILEQAEADNIQYGGELAPGSPRGRETYAKLLVPILKIEDDLSKLDVLVRDVGADQRVSLVEANKILSKKYFEKIGFKKIFNAFADNIYYSDPDRANMYLGGGATPKNEQSIAYLLRNDILTNIENLQAEVAYLLKEEKAGNPINRSEDVEDLFMYVQVAKTGMEKYLDLVPPLELKQGREFFRAEVN
jgi:hypothetical protein